MELLGGAFVVFAITLIVTKSKVFECKRQFVKDRYQASWTGSQRPHWLHTWWHAMWICPMCLGFWVSIAIAPWFHCFAYVFDVLILFSLNWLIHCLEDLMFQSGKFIENLLDSDENRPHDDV